MLMKKKECKACHGHDLEKGRALDGRRAYRCGQCGNRWTEGLQGREQKYSKQRMGDQFRDEQCR